MKACKDASKLSLGIELWVKNYVQPEDKMQAVSETELC
jgi:hypothetical protein